MKTAITTFCVLALAATAALARDWDDNFQPREPALKQPGHYEWSWDGADSLGLQAPVTLRYSPGGSPRIVITGPDELLAHIQVGQGQIRADRGWNWPGNDRLQVTVTGVTIHNIAVSGAGQVSLEKLNLDHLNVAVSGSGSVAGEGRSDGINVSLSGSGHVDLTHLQSRDANINIAGSGTVTDSGRSDHVNLNLTGSGHAELGKLQARETDIHFTGTGTINAPGGGEKVSLWLSGRGHVDLGQLQAREANIRMTGDGSVTGTGRSERVDLSLSGSGTADLAQLETRDAEIHIAGAGKVELTPRGTANVAISGSGIVRMAAKPAHLNQSVRGSGGVKISGD